MCTAVDDPGLALLAEGLMSLVDRGGSVVVVVPDALAAAVVSRAVPAAMGRSAVVIRQARSPVNAVALTYEKAGHQAYVGGAAWTAAALTEGAPGVLLDQRRDGTAAARVLADIRALADAAVAPAGQMLEDLAQPCMDDLEQRSSVSGVEAPAPRAGIPTGTADLDSLTGGISAGDLWVVTGRTGAGKTVLALGIARSASVGHGRSVCFISGHEGALVLTRMVLSAETKVPLHHMQMGTLSQDDWARLARRTGDVVGAPLRVVEAGTVGVASPTAALQLGAAQIAASRAELELLVLDGAQSSWTPEQLRELKELAVAHGIGVLVVMPDSGDEAAAETEASRIADLVLRVDRDHEMDERRTVSARAGESDLIVLRHRQGPVAVVTVAFQGHYARFVDLSA